MFYIISHQYLASILSRKMAFLGAYYTPLPVAIQVIDSSAPNVELIIQGGQGGAYSSSVLI